MEMHQVRYFLAVSRTLNFTRAAEECHVAQPSLTRAIKLLEDELGGELFRRERNLTHMTEFGQRMLPFLQQCYDSALSAKQLAQSLRSGEVSPLSVAVSMTVDVLLVAPFLTEIAQAMPGLEIRFLRGAAAAIAEHLKKGDVEVAIGGSLGETWDRLDAWPLFSERVLLGVNANGPLGQLSEIDIAALPAAGFIRREHCEAGADFESLLGDQGAGLQQKHSVGTDQDLIAFLEAGLGVGMLPESARHPSSVRLIPIAGVDMMRTVSCYAVAGRQRSIAASTLIKMLRAADWPQLLNRQHAA